ncbi:hypothetical protein BU599_12540, partial [Staphylococcus arlettae]
IVYNCYKNRGVFVMQQVKLKTVTAKTIEQLEEKINQVLQEQAEFQLLNTTIREFESHKYPTTEDEFTAMLTLVTTVNS